MRSNFFVFTFVATSKSKIVALDRMDYDAKYSFLFVPQEQIACFVFLLEDALRGIFEGAAIFGLGLL